MFFIEVISTTAATTSVSLQVQVLDVLRCFGMFDMFSYSVG